MESATIYSTKTGDTMSAGLQSGRVCDEAIRAAEALTTGSITLGSDLHLVHECVQLLQERFDAEVN